MAVMRVCVRKERQPAVQQVMEHLHTSDPKIAVDWIIADWLNKRDQPQGQGSAEVDVNLEIQEW